MKCAGCDKSIEEKNGYSQLLVYPTQENDWEPKYLGDVYYLFYCRCCSSEMQTYIFQKKH
jgi:hypothetical protein